ncbi:rpl32, partial [Coccomyxa viridis]
WLYLKNELQRQKETHEKLFGSRKSPPKRKSPFLLLLL